MAAEDAENHSICAPSNCHYGRLAPYASGTSLTPPVVPVGPDGRSVCAWGFPAPDAALELWWRALRMRVGLPIAPSRITQAYAGAPYARGASLLQMPHWSYGGGRSVCAWGFLSARICRRGRKGRSVCAWGFRAYRALRALRRWALRMRVGLPYAQIVSRAAVGGAPYARGASRHDSHSIPPDIGRSVCAWGFLDPTSRASRY